VEPKKRLKQLEEAYAAGYLDDEKYQHLKAELLNAAASVDNPPPTEQTEPATIPSMLPDDADTSPWENTSDPAELWTGLLIPGLEIGPPERRFILLDKLADEGIGQTWLAHESASANIDDQESFRKLWILAPQMPDQTAADGDDTPANPALSRAFLIKVKTRVNRLVPLEHPNIARIHGWRQDEDGWPFVEMEHLRGQTLAQLLERQDPPGLGWEQTLTIAQAIADALDYARQEHHLAHHNLQPGNIFITEYGTVKLLNFGAPYQSRENVITQPADAQAVEQAYFVRDLRALAGLCYLMLTGTPAVQPLVKPPELTAPAWQVLQQQLEPRQPDSPPSAQEFIQRLNTAQAVIDDPTENSSRRLVLLILLAISAASAYWWTAHNRFLESTTSRLPSVTTLPNTVTSPDNGAQTGVPDPEQQVVDERRKLDDQAYAAAQRRDTLDAYYLYLKRCPDCAHREAAEAAIERLERQAQIDALKARFEAHLQAGELTSGGQPGQHALATLQALGTLNPQHPFLTEGRKQIALAYGRWASASLAQGNRADARAWLAKAESVQPGLPELAALGRAIERAEVRAQDTAAFKRAWQINTPRAYRAYLDACAPICNHRLEAEKLLLQPDDRPTPYQILRDSLANGGLGPEMVVIPAGMFVMGSPTSVAQRDFDEDPRQVRIERPFAIGRYEVTFEEYDRFADATGRRRPYDEDWGRGQRPVINISWHDADAYARWLSEQTEQSYRLPTEAEWEYAVRAGTQTARYWGDDPDQACDYANGADLIGQRVFPGWIVANCRDGFIYTAPVGYFQANAFGLHDMLGNVLEWTCSPYRTGYGAPVQTCADAKNVTHFVVRGGSWSDQPRSLRAADRHKTLPGFQDYYLGMRLVRELEPQTAQQQ